MITLKFYGTRGMIEEHNEWIDKRSALLIRYKGFELLIDAGDGIDISKIKPDCILITHAGHPDHSNSMITYGASDIPIYCNRESARVIQSLLGYKPDALNVIPYNRMRKWKTLSVDPLIRIYPFRVLHSIIAPEIGFLIQFGKGDRKIRVLIPGDILWIDKDIYKMDVDVYIGDGSSLDRDIVRLHKEKKIPFGHASIRRQLRWIIEAGIPIAIFRHWGKWAIPLSKSEVREKIKELAEGKVKVLIAFDGSQFTIDRTDIATSRSPLSV